MIETKHRKAKGKDGLHLVEVYIDGEYHTMFGIEIEEWSGLTVLHVASNIKVSRFIPEIMVSTRQREGGES